MSANKRSTKRDLGRADWRQTGLSYMRSTAGSSLYA